MKNAGEMDIIHSEYQQNRKSECYREHACGFNIISMRKGGTGTIQSISSALKR
jgi:hypothetical protein